jgi:hypothetical protein
MKRKIKLIFREHTIVFMCDEFDDNGDSIVLDTQISVDDLIDMCDAIEGDEV